MANSEVDPDGLAKKTFILTVIGVLLYGSAVVAFVLESPASTGVPENDEAALAKEEAKLVEEEAEYHHE